MVFSLDEEMDGLTLQDDVRQSVMANTLQVPAAYNPEAVFDDNNNDLPDDQLNLHSPNGGRTRRRSSVLAKFPVLSPAHTRRVSISNNSPGAGASLLTSQLASSFKSATGSENALEEEAPQDMRPKSMRTIQDFRPIRVLGRGAYGKVILVKDQFSQKLYAMKQLKKAEILINDNDKGEDQDPADRNKDLDKRIERTFAERTILSQLEHPNIVKLFYSFHDHSKLYLILQFIPGGELFYHLKERGTLEEDTVAFYAAEVSCALKFLHDNGIVYRDLKPENCLLDQRGHLVLTDFGLSKKSATETQGDKTDSESDLDKDDIYTLHSIIGTPEYAAPEILQGVAYNKNCDWYSLGCLLYDMLVGKPPYTGNNHKVILNKIQKDKQGPRIPYYLSDGMKDVLNWLLKKDKTKRWDVDKYWSEDPSDNQKGGKKKKPGKQRVSKFQSHFIFRKINWKLMESGDLQRTTLGPIVPIITNWELAENFDDEFTSMSFEDDYAMNSIPIKSNSDLSGHPSDIFKGFSFKASGSYLERHF